MNTKILLSFLFLISSFCTFGQVIGSVKTEAYQADFEKKQSIDVVSDYEGPKIPVQLLNIGVTDEILTQYPELKDKRVGLGLTNIVIEFLEETNRFTFTEDKAEIKNRMVKQFQASQSGITENKLDGRGKIKLAQYFVYVEVYDFSVSEDEQLKLKDGVKQTQTTRLGLQVKFVNAETSEYITGSGLGEANTIKQGALSDSFDEIKFNQSTIGITTKKALETAASRIVSRMIKKSIFKN